MARKVFISILGTSAYYSCRYHYRQERSSETTFIQQATMELLHVDTWGAEDAAIFLLTKQAEESNWDPSITQRERKKELVPYRGLAKILEEMRMDCSIRTLSIPDGNNEDEIWEIFHLLFEALQEKDEVYIDLTHSFRYLPMLVLVLCSYAKFLKNIRLKSITYGNYEARDRETNIAPVIDLLPIAILQDWTFAAGQFMNGGNTQAIHQLCRDMTRSLFMQSEVPVDAAVKLSDYSNGLKRVIDEVVFCRGNEIISARSARGFKEATRSLGKSIIPPLNPLIAIISGSLKNIEQENHPKNMFWAAKWCCDNNYFQQAATILQEGVISSLCDRMSWNINDLTSRDSVGAAFYLVNEKFPLDEKKVKQGNPMKIASLITKYRGLLMQFAQDYSELAGLRNAFNHAGMGTEKNRRSVSTLVRNTRNWLGRFEPLFDGYEAEKTGSKHMLINLSNHPFSNWSEEQSKAALECGEVVDLPFPAVDPDLGSDYIDELAEEYFNKVTDIAGPESAVVHIMGELNLTVSLVGKLKAAGYKCLASTTSRMVTMDEKGNKVARFVFVRFREY